MVLMIHDRTEALNKKQVVLLRHLLHGFGEVLGEAVGFSRKASSSPGSEALSSEEVSW